MKYLVKATYRTNICDRNAPIAGLVLDMPYNGYTVHELKDLVSLAKYGQLWVSLVYGAPPVRVTIEWSPYYGRWVAKTDADTTTRNNLLSLPIFYPAQSLNGVTTYQVCSLT